MATAVRPHVNSPQRVISDHPSDVIYRCGELVPTPGTYLVMHRNHRSAHAAKVRFTAFPECAQCGQSVRFMTADAEKTQPTEWLRRDPDFRHVLAGKGRTKAARTRKKIGLSAVV